MISDEELLRIQVLKFMPVDILHRFFDEKIGDLYRDGFELSKKFGHFLNFVKQTQLVQKKETYYATTNHTEYSCKFNLVINKVLSQLLSDKSFKFVVGFFRGAMMHFDEDGKNFLYCDTTFISGWFNTNGPVMQQMIQEEKFKDWIEEEEKKCQ